LRDLIHPKSWSRGRERYTRSLQNVIQGRPEDQPNAPLGTYPLNDGDTVILAASAQLGMGSDQSGVDLNPQ
jgi:hypothetical protein